MKIIRPVTVGDTGSFTRATTGTYYDKTGTLQTAAIDVPRFNFDPLNLASGPALLIEPAATNLLLNSATLVTQSVTVVAGTYTLSFNGTGTVTRSDASVGAITGTASRTTITFATTAGSLTLTVTGTVTLAQLELGPKATSYYQTTGSTATRAADVNTAMLVSNIPETEYPTYASGTTYIKDQRVMELATHKVYQSVQAGNVGHALTDTLWWIEVGMNNRWSMFDSSVTSQSSLPGDIYVAIAPGARFDSIVGLNVAANSTTVKVVDSLDGVVFSSNLPLTSDSGIDNWFEYFYEPIVLYKDFIISGVPAGYSNSTITVAILGASSAAIGGLIIGLSKYIGVTEAGVKTGIQSYSLKTRTAFGNYVITSRAFSKRADFNVKIRSSDADSIQELLAGYRDTPIVYVGSNDESEEQYASTIIYGFYKDFSIDITYPPLSTCSIQIEGLT